MLPTFLLIGAMKSGTTTLYHYLARHPDVFMPALKEPNFFNDHWHRGIGWYERLFAPARAAVAGTGAAREPDLPGPQPLRHAARPLPGALPPRAAPGAPCGGLVPRAPG